jgi:hypothetical protein
MGPSFAAGGIQMPFENEVMLPPYRWWNPSDGGFKRTMNDNATKLATSTSNNCFLDSSGDFGLWIGRDNTHTATPLQDPSPLVARQGSRSLRITSLKIVHRQIALEHDFIVQRIHRHASTLKAAGALFRRRDMVSLGEFQSSFGAKSYQERGMSWIIAAMARPSLSSMDAHPSTSGIAHQYSITKTSEPQGSPVSNSPGAIHRPLRQHGGVLARPEAARTLFLVFHRG